MIDTILYFAVVTIASHIAFDYNYLLKMISIDSLFSAIHFMKSFVNKNISDSQVIKKSNSLYGGSLIDRYIYYLIVYGLYNIICAFFWIDHSYLLYYIGLLTIIPTIINKILGSKLFDVIKERKEYMAKIIISKILTMVIKFYSKLYLDRDLNLKNSEILELLKDYKEALNCLSDVVKNSFIILLLSYAKSYASIYYGIIKYAYNYKTGDLLTSYNTISAKQHLINIIDNRKWNELSKPNAYKAMLCLYQTNDEKSDTLCKLFKEFNFAFVKMFSIWTMASLCGSVYLVPLFSICMLLYRQYIGNKVNDKIISELIIICIFGSLSYFIDSYLVISALCQFGSKIIFNRMTYLLIKIIRKFVKKISTNIITTNGDLLIAYVTTIVYILILKFMDFEKNYVIICLNIMANMIMNVDTKKQIVFGLLISSTHLSSYNLLHILYNSSLLYIITGISNKYNIFTFQDNVREMVSSLIILFDKYLNIVISIIQTLYENYLAIRKRFKEKLRNLLIENIDSDKQMNLRFKLMDTDRFPSVSAKINNNVLIDSVSIDDKVFDIDDDNMFIDGIGIDDKKNDDNCTVVSKGSYSVMQDFVK